MEADGLELIELNGSMAHAGDFWTAGKSFTPSSTPNSTDYSGFASNVYVTRIGALGDAIPVTLSIGLPADPNAPSDNAAMLPNQKRCAPVCGASPYIFQ